MGKQDEERYRSGPFRSRMLLLRTMYDTRSGVIDSSEILLGTSFLLLTLLKF